MKITFDTVTHIPAGVALRLTPEQAAARESVLEAWGDEPGVVVGTVALQFKIGETVDIVGDLPKGILPVYDRLRAEQAAEEPKPAKPPGKPKAAKTSPPNQETTEMPDSEQKTPE